MLCSIQIQVLLSESNEPSKFLDLMLFVNRSPDPMAEFQSTMDIPSTSSLLDIFIHLPSPHMDHHLSDWCENPDILGFLNEDIQVEIPGMKTRLYTYQKHSLWKILQRELAPFTVEPYEIVRLIATDNSYYYFNQLTGEITLESRYIPDAQGGIICEDMGTGKTCICLATIMATKDLSNPMCHAHTLKTNYPKHALGVVPSLKEITATMMLHLGINWKPMRQQLPSEVVDWFQKYPIYYEWTDIAPHYHERARRIEPNFTTLAVYLSNATLVVVPDNLVAQWTGEIYKHIQDGQLRFLVYDDVKQKIIAPIELADTDLVLISQSRFSLENSKGGLDFSTTGHVCQCPYIGSTRQRACVCSVASVEKYTSPLLQVHWKRLIVDEGHRLSSKNRQSELSSKLFSNWKWICTGTPTQNLTESASTRTRQESQMDDLNRLGTLFGQALNIEPFKSNKKLWNKMVSKPFLEGKPWAITKLTNIMERTMVRNQRIDMEKEVTLPPLHQNTVYLDFDYYQWIAHNCQIAMISLNAILSKREGPDYLFTAKNHKALRETVFNLWQSCLWHSVDLKLLQMAYDNCVEKCSDVEQGKSDYGNENKDLVKIRQVLFHALDNKMFVCMMGQHAPSYVVQGLPPLFKETWGWLKGDHGVYEPLGTLPWDDHCIVSAERVLEAMDVVVAAKNDNTKDLFVYDGSNQTLVSIQEFESNKKKKKHAQEIAMKKSKSNLSSKVLPGGSRNSNDAATPTEEASYMKMDEGNTWEEQQQAEGQLTYYTRNAFSDARVLSSSSVKINYLVNQICRYQATEKCIIFSQHYNEMYEIYLALELARVRVLMYQDNKLNNTKRSQMILTFNTSDNANVIIMAVQKAAYGIDLSSATRVFFVSPVWQTAMEQQAIKRAHRIGQTKPVYIETLVIRNTIEDELLKRREQVSIGDEVEEDKENLKRGDFFADSKLRNILNHARFVPLPKAIYKDQVTGAYWQKIVPLDRPLDFVPNGPSLAAGIVKNTDDTQEAPLAESMQLPLTLSSSEMNQIYDEFDVDVDASDQEEEKDSIQEDAQTFTGAFNVHEDYLDQTSSISSTSQHEDDEDDIILDIEGDDDAMDSIPPWKLRLMDQEKRYRIKQTPSPPIIQVHNKGKRKHSLSPPLIKEGSSSVPNSHQKESDAPERKKKKTVRFA
ncbi:snf2 family helicase [Mucor ambiguus]|uniref:Snf2 family helicase n=1 Tax=Mucor ambiguus TaxID=91626 RepID=A0A0C9MNY6_9FUNG|nr:snf2 family helicase [Mucor ambiguus]